ncbi:MAG TPA: BTAD domain-containing putative transcriptional regulator, partial [Pseudonocardia sp.]
MRFRDLGPLGVELDGMPRPLAGRRLETLLAALLVHPDGVAPTAMVELVWGAAPPPGAAGALDSLVWRLRRLLEPGRGAREESALVRDDRGYRLAVPAAAVDSRAFAEAAAQVVARAGSDDPARLVAAADRALDCWRGRPYEGVTDAGWLEPVRTRLVELRLEVQQQRVNALLAAGRPERAVADVAPLLVEHPFRERLWALRMLGLYRAGRQAAALQAFHEARRALDADLGIEPGPELRRLHERILVQDPGLDDRRPGACPRAQVRLPRHRSRLVGRERELAAVATELRPGTVVTIAGPVGCGKTRLAVEAARRCRAAFPGGVWFAELAPVTDPSRVADRVAAAVGVVAQADTGVRDALTAFLAPRTALLVLDNCEHLVRSVAALADELLEAAPGLTVLATSREPLEVEDERVHRLAPLAPPTGDAPAELAASPAVDLFLDRLARWRGPLDLAGPEGPAVGAICRVVDGLPLGIELAAGRARTFELHEVADGLRRHLDVVAPGGGGITLRAGVEWSHRLATSGERVAHRRLAVLPPGFTLAAATAVCAAEPLVPAQVPDLLAGLVHRSLLVSGGAARRGGPSLFTQLAPIRAHAAEALHAAREAEPAEARREAWVVEQVAAGPWCGRPGRPEWYDLLDDNAATVGAALDAALAGTASDDVLLTVARLALYWNDRMHVVEGGRLAERAARRAVPPDRFPAAAAVGAHGMLLALAQRMVTARPLLEAALAAAPRSPRVAEAGHLVVQWAAAAWAGDDWPLAARA